MTATTDLGNAAGRGGPAGRLLLDAQQVTMQFGGLKAVDKVDLQVHAGEIVGLIGPNGAGKTTFFNCLTGLYVADRPAPSCTTASGCRRKPYLVAKAGMARTFQNIRLFPNMTAQENVMVGRHVRMKQGILSAIGRGPNYRRGEKEARDKAAELLAFVGLGRQSDNLARNLTYGDQRRLEIARALASDPTTLLLDEPTAGMNPQETRATQELIFTDPRAGPGRRGDRARHAVHLPALRPGGLPDPGREADRGHAGRGAVRPAGDRGLHRRCRPAGETEPAETDAEPTRGAQP